MEIDVDLLGGVVDMRSAGPPRWCGSRAPTGGDVVLMLHDLPEHGGGFGCSAQTAAATCQAY
jgi:hypothetical protein